MRIGVDVGSVRIGVARTDPGATLAVPVETVPRGEGDLARIAALAAEHGAIEVVVGLPLGLSGRPGPAAEAARAFAAGLAPVVAPVPVRLVDERLSTVSATRGLREAGRSSRRQRTVVDQAAAVVIVQYAVDTERATGRAPGTLVELGR
ncbi:MAG: Holliday junction resolvase RuvX [Candidatus Nanopelagicales bacterium]|nr:Holliday junction resolvase RuvX [Candidatus Nanopelagicales bacterium]